MHFLYFSPTLFPFSCLTHLHFIILKQYNAFLLPYILTDLINFKAFPRTFPFVVWSQNATNFISTISRNETRRKLKLLFASAQSKMLSKRGEKSHTQSIIVMKVLEMSVECKLIAFYILNYFNRDATFMT